jgi:hypothetical protein
MPVQQAILAQGFGEVLGGVEHHFDDPLDIAFSGDRAAGIHAKAARDGRAHLVGWHLELGLTFKAEAQPGGVSCRRSKPSMVSLSH